VPASTLSQNKKTPIAKGDLLFPMASAGRMLYREGKHAGHFYSRQAKGGCRLKINILFLLIGLVLSIISKMAQAAGKSKIGEVVVVPAAVFFVLAVLFSIPKYTALLSRENGAREAAQIGF
jgi:hypothetical protein